MRKDDGVGCLIDWAWVLLFAFGFLQGHWGFCCCVLLFIPLLDLIEYFFCFPLLHAFVLIALLIPSSSSSSLLTAHDCLGHSSPYLAIAATSKRDFTSPSPSRIQSYYLWPCTHARCSRCTLFGVRCSELSGCQPMLSNQAPTLVNIISHSSSPTSMH